MTCVWDGLLNGLKIPLNRKDFIEHLKINNCKTPEIKYKINNSIMIISDKQLDENYQAIKTLSIGDGYLCSICDPLFFIVSKLFKVNIHHMYLSSNIEYIFEDQQNSLYFQSNRGHFWFVKSITGKKIDSDKNNILNVKTESHLATPFHHQLTQPHPQRPQPQPQRLQSHQPQLIVKQESKKEKKEAKKEKKEAKKKEKKKREKKEKKKREKEKKREKK